MQYPTDRPLSFYGSLIEFVNCIALTLGLQTKKAPHFWEAVSLAGRA